MGLCPKSFGPYFWGAFHLACLAAVDKDSLKTFIETYQMILPCFWCRLHFSQLLAEYPVPDTDQFRWSVEIHNKVNERLNKPLVTYEEALEHWLSGCEPPSQPEPFMDTTTVLLIALLFGFILSLLIKNYRK
jgi:hypothetical protein